MYLRDYYPEGSVVIGEGITPPLPGFRTQIGSPNSSDWAPFSYGSARAEPATRSG